MSKNVALLNPSQEAAVCNQMRGAIASRLEVLERDLTHSALEREQYLKKIGAALVLRELVQEADRIYARNFEV